MKNIVVIGASAGGIPAVKSLLSGFKDQMDAAFFVVQHLSPESDPKALVAIFQRQTAIICHVAADGMPIESGNLYLAPPNHHLILDGEFLAVTSGAYENKYRPSIDVLFRSAAVNFGNRVIGIILTGLLEDGTSGMSAIKRCGGRCIVQHPDDAQFYSMPLSVINVVKVDRQAGLTEIPAIVGSMLNEPVPPAVPVPKELQVEADITKRMMSHIDDLKIIADHSDFVCPDCGGGLWAVKNDPVQRYRCHTGHTYTAKLLENLQQEHLEESVWVSIRMFEEKVNLLKVTAARQPENNSNDLSRGYARRIAETEEHIRQLKKLLQNLTSG